MFKENTNHLQYDVFGVETYLPERKLKKLLKSREYTFYELIFCNIDETQFSVLYSDKKSRPNSAINAMVSSLILMQQKGWTYERLFDQIDFDLKTRVALGLQSLADTPFVESTLFEFQTKVNDYWVKEGVNLFEVVFDSLTQKQLKELNIKTDIQRSDSFLAASNIRKYNRIMLLVEVLIRFHRVLSEKDKAEYGELLSPYVKKSSGQFIYRLNREDIPHELEKLGQVYHALFQIFKSRYGDQEIFQILERVYEEHFTVVPACRSGREEKVAVKSSDELHSGMLQSPDDIDATYRKKGDEESQGQVINITETTNPDNDLHLLTDVSVEPNNTDDSDILNERLDIMKEKTPDFKELHTDGGYGSEDNDKKMEKHKIDHIQTAVRGKESEVPIEIEQLSERSCGEENKYSVSCPQQKVLSQPTPKRHKACFDIQFCNDCDLKEVCPTSVQTRKPCRVYYFTHEDYLADKRRRGIEKIPKERRKLRPNVEATVKEFKTGMNHKGKLKVRGKFKTEVYAFTTAISINFGRIYRYITANPDQLSDFLPHPSWFLRVIRTLSEIVRFLAESFGQVNILLKKRLTRPPLA